MGTQTIGSIVRPAAFCGATGYKPTSERISRAGVIPLSPTLDHIGVFAASVSLIKQAAQVLVDDWKTINSVKKPILGIPDGPYLNSASGYAQACFRTTCNSLSQAGYEIKHIEVMNNFTEIKEQHQIILASDAAQVHAEWFKKHEHLYSEKFQDLIKRGQNITPAELNTALTFRENFKNEMMNLMQANNIDIWVCPSAPDAAPKGLASTGDPVMNLPWTQIGFPALNLPTHKNDENLPIGLQLVGDFNQDENLINWAEPIEKVVDKR